ncbi:MAG TPA: phosphomannose isomerase type II C-terminal cupin domain [Syntrophales bacterium]|nr:phosphomannose isomerase type II C-terminal cupin domain [Syntrophales bacterium]HOM06585.1 phosphomannose isomerase type II C-terminal cupin domain [Syntrophales bacterium]HON99632.1 phosphomannose isomerase type II C-terminal cupin domain [Syntrophales bacterium]HPC00697.1 phosphomannose isomerase type II C-terminal cupin domain [Syntrophales bacterium]HPQ06153.1 phosphomannose isomerase type II C-terminal cupin domain [Syntrophales bacterium]
MGASLTEKVKKGKGIFSPAAVREERSFEMERGDRPWGYYVVLADEEDHKVKRIVVRPNRRLSLQRHRRRDEHWFVLAGEGVITLGDREITVGPGDSVDIPRGTAHRIAAVGKEDLRYIEVQRGDYFGEDDIERLEDDYGRL